MFGLLSSLPREGAAGVFASMSDHGKLLSIEEEDKRQLCRD